MRNTVGVDKQNTFGDIVAHMNTYGLKKAIEKAGSQQALAELLGVRQSHISNWLNREKRIPAERVLSVESATGVPRHELRPDLYPCDGQAA